MPSRNHEGHEEIEGHEDGGHEHGKTLARTRKRKKAKRR